VSTATTAARPGRAVAECIVLPFRASVPLTNDARPRVMLRPTSFRRGNLAQASEPRRYPQQVVVRVSENSTERSGRVDDVVVVLIS